MIGPPPRIPIGTPPWSPTSDSDVVAAELGVDVRLHDQHAHEQPEQQRGEHHARPGQPSPAGPDAGIPPRMERRSRRGLGPPPRFRCVRRLGGLRAVKSPAAEVSGTEVPGTEFQAAEVPGAANVVAPPSGASAATAGGPPVPLLATASAGRRNPHRSRWCSGRASSGAASTPSVLAPAGAADGEGLARGADPGRGGRGWINPGRSGAARRRGTTSVDGHLDRGSGGDRRQRRSAPVAGRSSLLGVVVAQVGQRQHGAGADRAAGQAEADQSAVDHASAEAVGQPAQQPAAPPGRVDEHRCRLRDQDHLGVGDVGVGDECGLWGSCEVTRRA